MSSKLSAIPIGKRRHLAAVLGLFSVLLVTIGLVVSLGRGTAATILFSAVSLVSALLLGLVAWGVTVSVRNDLAEAGLDRAIEAEIAASGGAMCDCGHDRDPNEMHVSGAEDSDAPCAHDGAGADCAHSCDTCVLRAMRPSPTASRERRLSS